MDDNMCSIIDDNKESFIIDGLEAFIIDEINRQSSNDFRERLYIERPEIVNDRRRRESQEDVEERSNEPDAESSEHKIVISLI